MKPFRDFSLRRKLTLAILATSVVPLVLAAALVFGYQLASLRADAAGDLDNRAELLAVSLRPTLEFNDPARAEELLATLQARPELVAAAVYARDGKVFASYRRSDAEDLDLPPAPAGAVDSARLVGGHLQLLHPIRSDLDTVGHIYLRADLAALYASLPQQGLIVLGVLAGLLLLAYWLSHEFQRVISRPILALAETAQAVAERKDYSVRAVRHGQDEIGRLTDGFNQMLAGIQARDAALLAENTARHQAEAATRALNADLERRVQERTAELLTANAALTDFKAALDEHAIVAITDAHGKITYANDKFCAISKYARAELLGQDHRIINSGQHSKAFMRDLWQTITSGRVWQGELKNRAKNGTCYWVSSTLVPFLGADGQPAQYIAIRTDITERKLAEERNAQLNVDLQRQAAQLEAANHELESFSYSVSHDLRAPLRHIHGYVEMLTDATAGQLAEQPRHYLKTITAVSEEMGELIDDLLAFSRMGRVELTEARVALDDLVLEVQRGLELAVQGRNLQWQIASLPPVLGDRAMLRQVLANLLGNAVKYTRGRAPAKIEIGLAGEEAGRTIFFVRDNGAGFDMKYAHKLFGVFQRLHRADEFEGTGIGLATVRRVIARHGGRTWAEGKPGAGATFYFTLPRADVSLSQNADP